MQKEIPMSLIKQVKEKLVEAFNANNVSSTVVYDDKCVVCYVTKAEDAMLAIKDLTKRVYFTASPNIFACLMDNVSVAIVVGVESDNIENVYHYIKDVLRGSFQFTVPKAYTDGGEQKTVAPVKVDFNAKFAELRNKVISALSGKVANWELYNVIIPLKKETEEIAFHRVLVIKTGHPSLVSTTLAEAFATEFINYDELGTAFLGFVDGLPVRVYDRAVLYNHGIDIATVSAIHRTMCTGSMLFNCPDRSFLLEQSSDRYCVDISTSFAEYVTTNGVISGRFETGEYDCMMGIDSDDVVKLEEMLKVTYGIEFEPMDACHSIGFFGKLIVVTSSRKRPGCGKRYKLRMDLFDMVRQYVKEKDMPVSVNQEKLTQLPSADDVKEKPMPKGQYNLFCNAHQEAPASSLNIFNHAVNVVTGDRLFKAIFRLIESYMRHFNMVSIPSLYHQGWVTDPAKIPTLYSMTPTGTLQWDRHAIIMLPTCQEVEWHSSQYISEVPRKHNETFLLCINDKEGRQFKVAIHGVMSSYHGKQHYLMNIFEILKDNQDPYVGDVYEHLMNYLNN